MPYVITHCIITDLMEVRVRYQNQPTLLRSTQIDVLKISGMNATNANSNFYTSIKY